MSNNHESPMRRRVVCTDFFERARVKVNGRLCQFGRVFGVVLFLILNGCSTTGSLSSPVQRPSVVDSEAEPEDIEVIRSGDQVGERQHKPSEDAQEADWREQDRDEQFYGSEEPEPVYDDGPLRSVEAQLLAEAAEHFQSGSLQLASASVERALRINPHSAMALVELAKLRLAQNAPREAEQLLLKAVGAGSYDHRATQTAFQRQAWTLIVQARDALGDRQGVMAAQARLDDLSLD